MKPISENSMKHMNLSADLLGVSGVFVLSDLECHSCITLILSQTLFNSGRAYRQIW